MHQQNPATMLCVLRLRSRTRTATRQSTAVESRLARSQQKIPGGPRSFRVLPEPLRPMDTAPQDFCGEVSARSQLVLHPSEKSHGLEADHREGSRAGYPPAIGEATDVVLSAFHRK